MNLINCSRNCRHQREGLCHLDSVAAVADSGDAADCSYYQQLSAGSEAVAETKPDKNKQPPV